MEPLKSNFRISLYIFKTLYIRNLCYSETTEIQEPRTSGLHIKIPIIY